MAITVPTLSVEQRLMRDGVAAAVAGVAAVAGTPATYLRKGSAVDAAGAVINVELKIGGDAVLKASGQRLPARVLTGGASGLAVRGMVSVAAVRGGETVNATTGVGSLGGVAQLRDGDRLAFRGVDVGVPDQDVVVLFVRNTEPGQGVWTGEVSAV